MPPAKTNKSGIRKVRVSKKEIEASQSKTKEELLLVSYHRPTTPDGRLRDDFSTDPAIMFFEALSFGKNLTLRAESICSGSLVLSIGRIIHNEYTLDLPLIEVVSPTGKVGFVNPVFLYRLDQVALESLSKQNE